MACRCDVCGKEPKVGKQISHSHKSSSRRWLPNIRRVRAYVNGQTKRIKVCTRCLRSGKVERAR